MHTDAVRLSGWYITGMHTRVGASRHSAAACALEFPGFLHCSSYPGDGGQAHTPVLTRTLLAVLNETGPLRY
eukprot:3240250-Rhodomonas_salina.1